MSDKADAPSVSTLSDLLAVAYQIEVDAIERYKMLAEQMETHNNVELAAVFRDLARAEGIHAAEIRRLAGDVDVAALGPEVGQWMTGDSPEAADLSSAHYMMSRAEALRMALAGEERALAFFEEVVKSVEDPEARELAKQLVEEEREHVELCHQLIRRHDKPLRRLGVEDPDAPEPQG
ncbi:MAG: ferritin family protein [Gammaproteobacteria bacterium]|nr:ferritin family protein [Gammaproteobacteria bacterium]MDH4256137.1 ferritin family protein [Gammaproteobacteria bacterium]MDH5310622.1 ferritin family protein [Gammaproteobacteria bacterium]